MKNKANTKLKHTMHKLFFIIKLVLSAIMIVLIIYSMFDSPRFLPELFNSFRINWPTDWIVQKIIILIYFLFLLIILGMYSWWLITIIRNYQNYQELASEYENLKGDQTNE